MHEIGAGLSKEDYKSKPQCYTAVHRIGGYKQKWDHNEC